MSRAILTEPEKRCYRFRGKATKTLVPSKGVRMVRLRFRLEDLAAVVVLVSSIIILLLGYPEVAVAVLLLLEALILLVRWRNER